MKFILGYMILKAIEYSLGVLNGGIYVYRFTEFNITLFGKNRRDALLIDVEEIERNFK